VELGLDGSPRGSLITDLHDDVIGNFTATTGLTGSISVNQDVFFHAPVQTPQPRS